jgi:hypothetical protein
MSLIPYGDLQIVTPTTGDGGTALTNNFKQISDDIAAMQTSDAGNVKLDGSRAMAGDLSLGGHSLTNVNAITATGAATIGGVVTAESFSGPLTGTASGNLPLGGGTLTGALSGTISTMSGGFNGPSLSSTANNTTLVLQNRGFSSAGDMVDLATGTFSNSSSTGVAVAIKPTLSTTGTGGWTALQINATQSSDTGTGAKYLINAQVGGVSKFAVTSTGQTTIQGGMIINGSILASGGWSGSLSLTGGLTAAGAITANGGIQLNNHSITDGTNGVIYSTGNNTFYGSFSCTAGGGGITMNGTGLKMGDGTTGGTGGAIDMQGGALFMNSGTIYFDAEGSSSGYPSLSLGSDAASNNSLIIGTAGTNSVCLSSANLRLNTGGGTGGGTLSMDGGMLDWGSNPGGAPTNTSTPAGWVQVKRNGTAYYMPLYS